MRIVKRKQARRADLNLSDAWEVCQALNAEDIICDYRPGAGIRFSPHFYSAEEEALSALDRAAEILENGEQKRFLEVLRRPG